MIQWALGASGVAILAIGAAVLIVKAKNRKIAEVENHNSQLQAIADNAMDKINKQNRTIEVLREAHRNAAQEKAEITDHADPGDRARAATDKLRELSRDRDRDDSSASD